MNKNTEHGHIIFHSIEKEPVALSPRYIELNSKRYPFHADTRKTLALAHTESYIDHPLLMGEVLSALTLGAPLIIEKSAEDHRPLKAFIKEAVDASGYVVQTINVENADDQDALDKLCLEALDGVEKIGYSGTDLLSTVKAIKNRRKEHFEVEDIKKEDSPSVMTDQAIIERMYAEKDQRSEMLKKEEDTGVQRLEIEGEHEHPFFFKIHNPKSLPTGRRQVFVIEHFEKLSKILQQCISIYCGNTLSHQVEHLHLANPTPGLVIMTRSAGHHKDILQSGVGVYIDADEAKFTKKEQPALFPSKAKTEETPLDYSTETLKRLPTGKAWFRLSTWFSEYASGKKTDPKVWHALARLDRAVQTHLLLRRPEDTDALIEMLRDLVPLLAKKTDIKSTKDSEKVYIDLLDLLENRDKFVEKVVYQKRSQIFKILGKTPQEATEEDGELLAERLEAIESPTKIHLLGKSVEISPLNKKKTQLREALRAAIYEIFATGNYPATATALKNTEESFPSILSELGTESPFYWLSSLPAHDTKALQDAADLLIGKAKRAWNKHMTIEERQKEFHYLEGRWEDVISKRLEELPVLFEYIVLSYLLLAHQDSEVKADMRNTLQETLLGLRDNVDPLKLLLRSEEEIQLIADRKIAKKKPVSETSTSEDVREEAKTPVILEYSAQNMHVNPLTKAAPFLRAGIKTMLPRDWDIWADIVHPEFERLQNDCSAMKKAPIDPHLIEYVSRFTQAQLDLLTLHFYSMRGDTSPETSAEQDSFLDKEFLEQNIMEMVDPVLRLIKNEKLNMHIKSLMRIESIDFHLQHALEVLLLMSTMTNDQMHPETLHIRAEFLRKHSKNDGMLKYLRLVLADGERGEEAEKKAEVRLRLLTSFTFRSVGQPSLPPLPVAEE